MKTLLAYVLGFVLMWPLGWLFGVMNWPLFHSWGQVHGSFVLAWPALSVLSYLSLSLSLSSRQRGRSGLNRPTRPG